MNKRLKLLLLTSACDGTDVGEAWSSFQWVSGLSQVHDVTLLTYRKRNRPSAIGQLPGVRVIEWVDPPLIGRFDRLNSMAKPGYVLFYLRARRWICQALRRGECFDLAHQISPLAIRYPSPATGLGLPLVLGPLAGSIQTPPAFTSDMGKVPWYTRLRGIDQWRIRHDPLLRRTLTDSQCVLVVAPYMQDLLGCVPIRRLEFISETGVVELPEAIRTTFNVVDPIRLLYVGRLTRAKGAFYAIRALDHLRDLPQISLDIVGEGEDRKNDEQEVSRLGLVSRVRFHGKVSRQKVDDFYRQSHIFLFPSIREPSGNSVLEAMSHGLAMVVAANGGPAAAVSDACGVKVDPVDPVQYVVGLAAAVRRLVEPTALLAQMGSATRARIAQDYLWCKKIEWLCRLYIDLLTSHEGHHENTRLARAVGMER